MSTTQTPTRGATETSTPVRTTPVWAVVARREVMVKLRDRSFLVGGLLMLAMIVGLIGFQVWMEGRSTTYSVAVSSPDARPMLDELVERAPETDDATSVEPTVLEGDAEARAAVEDDEVDAWLRYDSDGEWSVVTRETADSDLRQLVEDVVRSTALASNAAAAGTTVEELTAGSEVGFEQLEGDAQLSTLRSVLGFAMAMLFYIASILFGMTLAQSVTEEKQSRIVEMIAAAVPLRQLLAGKILGNTALAVGQMAVYVAIGLVGLSFTEFGGLVGSISGNVVWFLVFFLVGFLALSCLWAVAGALASRNEDLQHTATPVTMMLVVIFFGSLVLEGRWAVVASYVPPVSTIAMPMRLVEGTAGWWEAAIALALLVAFAALLVVGAERLYRRALMQTGGRMTLRQAWQLEE